MSLTGEPDEWGRKVVPFIDTRERHLRPQGASPRSTSPPAAWPSTPTDHVLREDGSVIPNLYAAGDVCGSIEEKDGCNYKMGFDAAMAFGYIMADSINTDLGGATA